MGRSNNSFMGCVGRATETVNEDRVTLPEKDLWVAVLCRAVLDACKNPPDLNMTSKANRSHKNLYDYNRDAARSFFMQGGHHFRQICEMAGRNPDYVQARIRKVLLRGEGWNVDVPLTSHYRQGPKRGRKRGTYKTRKNSTEVKRGRPRKKDPKMFLQGLKGGRPRLYDL